MICDNAALYGLLGAPSMTFELLKQRLDVKHVQIDSFMSHYCLPYLMAFDERESIKNYISEAVAFFTGQYDETYEMVLLAYKQKTYTKVIRCLDESVLIQMIGIGFCVYATKIKVFT